MVMTLWSTYKLVLVWYKFFWYIGSVNIVCWSYSRSLYAQNVECFLIFITLHTTWTRYTPCSTIYQQYECYIKQQIQKYILRSIIPLIIAYTLPRSYETHDMMATNRRQNGLSIYHRSVDTKKNESWKTKVKSNSWII